MSLILFFTQARAFCRIAFLGPSVARTRDSASCSTSLVVYILAILVIVLHGQEASAVRPFVTDDARVIYPGQLEIENFGGITMSRGREPGFELRSLQGASVSDRWRSLQEASGFSTRTTK